MSRPRARLVGCARSASGLQASLRAEQQEEEEEMQHQQQEEEEEKKTEEQQRGLC